MNHQTLSGTTLDLSALLRAALDQLDIPDDLYEEAVSAYEEVGRWLSQHFEKSDTGCEIYPQGSFRLGTVVRPVGRDEYDIDLVCLRLSTRESITQQGLKNQVGDALKLYVRAGPSGGSSRLRERRRCWTLEYKGRRFHLDVLPSIPDDDIGTTAILLTDRKLRKWQHSDPIGYADWFHSRMLEEFTERRLRLAARMGIEDVENVPTWQVKTSLQRAVQFLKRHRDLAFHNDPDDRPVSIIITTLAALAYEGGGDLLGVIRHIVEHIDEFIERRDGVWWVANPIQPGENFADKWNIHPERHRKFFRWLGQLRSDLEDLAAEGTTSSVLTRLASMLGEEPVETAARLSGITAQPSPAEAVIRQRDPGEEFIEDHYPVDLRYSASLTGTIKRKDGFRHGELRSFANRVGKHRSLVFKVARCDVPEPYDIYWKIKNTGDEAARLGQLRGSVFHGGTTHSESTLYQGDHYAECYIIKDGICVASDRQPVLIP